VAEFFVDGKLGGNAAAGLDLAHAAGQEAFELLIGSAEGDDESIEVFGEAGFDEESSFDEGGVANARTLPGVELEEHGLFDAGMENGVKAMAASLRRSIRPEVSARSGPNSRRISS
jgi:hypothetical protein